MASELRPKGRDLVSQHEDDAHTALTVNESAFHNSPLKCLSYSLDLDAFKLWYWRRLLKVPSTAGRSNQSISREINPEYSLEGLILKLKLQYFRHLIRIYDSLEKSLMLGKIEGRRRRGHWRMRQLDSITDAMNMNLGFFFNFFK